MTPVEVPSSLIPSTTIAGTQRLCSQLGHKFVFGDLDVTRSFGPAAGRKLYKPHPSATVLHPSRALTSSTSTTCATTTSPRLPPTSLCPPWCRSSTDHSTVSEDCCTWLTPRTDHLLRGYRDHSRRRLERFAYESRSSSDDLMV